MPGGGGGCAGTETKLVCGSLSRSPRKTSGIECSTVFPQTVLV